MDANPTPRAQWVKVGDRCTTVGGTMQGTVKRIVWTASVSYVVVQWPRSEGRHTITTLRKV